MRKSAFRTHWEPEEMMTYPMSKIKLGSEGRYETRYFQLSFQLSADPVLTGECRDADLHNIVCCEGYTGSSTVIVSLGGQSVQIGDDIGVSHKPFICLKKNPENWSGVFHCWFSHCWPSLPEISPLLPPDTSLPQKLRKHHLYSLPSYWCQEMIQDHSGMQKSL